MRVERMAVVWCVVAACGGSSGGTDPDPDPDPDPTLPYVDVSAARLPSGVLGGLSMDASVADLDADGDLDIVVANEFGRNILLLNDGAGGFSDGSARLPSSRRDSEDIGIADFDGDGDLDIVIVSEDDRVNELYLNDGTARFSDASDRIPVTGVSNAVLVTDLDGDGDPDILIGNNGQNVALVNDGQGRFTDETALRLPAVSDVTQDLELGDVDGDGDLDLVVGNEDANRLLINDGFGVFADESLARIPLRGTPEETREADFGDVDGDGDLDLYFANVDAFVAGADPSNRLLLNDGAGAFSDASARLPPGFESDRSFEADLIDLDRDGDLDILTGNLGRAGPSPFRVFLNDGAGRFSEGTSVVFPTSVVGNGFDAETADFDADGVPDLFLASRGSPDLLLRGR